LYGVPTMFIAELALPDFGRYDLSSLRTGIMAGSPCPVEVMKRCIGEMHMEEVTICYGMTETSPVSTQTLTDDPIDKRVSTVGRVHPHVEVEVIDAATGLVVDRGETGELCTRGYSVMLGYWNDPEKTAERYRPLPKRESGLVLEELAVFSGDTVRMDDEGFLYFIGRRDEMIKTSGYRVSPTEVEEVLYSTQLVGEAAAFGVPHPVLGQAIVVVATPKSQAPLDRDELLAECRNRLPIYMVPAEVSIQPGPLPRNPNGKIDRKSLAHQFQDLFDEVRT